MAILSDYFPSRVIFFISLVFSLILGSCNNSGVTTDQRGSSDGRAGKVNGELDRNSEDGQDEESEVATDPVNITGVYLADYDNSRIRCDYVQQSGEEYTSKCLVTVAQDDGSELKAVRVKEGVVLEWNNPSIISGEADIGDCEQSKNLLAYTCKVSRSNNLEAVKLGFALKISKVNKPDKIERADLLLPYSVGVTAGFVPSVPFQYKGQESSAIKLASQEGIKERVGFQQFDYPADSVVLPQPYAACMRGNDLYFAQGSFIYRLSNGRITLYAGSLNIANSLNTSHRLRIALAPASMACDTDAIYVSSLPLCRVVKIVDEGPVEIVAGEDFACGKSEDGKPAKGAALGSISKVEILPKNEIAFAELSGRVRKITSDGLLETIYDYGEGVSSLDEGWTIFNSKSLITGLVADAEGNIYVADMARQIIDKISKDGQKTRMAGNGKARYENKNDPFALSDPISLHLGKDGSLYFGESFQGIRRITSDLKTEQVAWVNNVMNTSFLQLDELAKRDLTLSFPTFEGFLISEDGSMITGGPLGLLKFSDKYPSNPISIAGGIPSTNDCEMPYDASKHHFVSPSALAVSSDNRLLIADWKHPKSNQIVIWELLKSSTGVVTRGLYGCDEQAALKAQNHSVVGQVPFNDIGDMVSAPDDSIYFANAQQNSIFRIFPDGTIKGIAGNGEYESAGDGGLASKAKVKNPMSLALGADGALYFVEAGFMDLTSKVRKIGNDGIISTVAGVGEAGEDGEDGVAILAKIKAASIAVDKKNRLFIADQGNRKLKMVDEKGIIKTIAGGGLVNPVDMKDNMDATQISLAGPTSVSLGNDGTVYFIDNGIAALELKEQEEGVWNISLLFGGQTHGDCGSGRKSGSTVASNSRDVVKNSLTIICSGTMRRILVKDTCPAKNGETRIILSQSFDDYANIVEIVKPCAQ